MSNKDLDLNALQEMKLMQCSYVNWGMGGGGEVQRIHNVYVLFEIPLYGGAPQYVGAYQKDELHKLVDMAYSWT